MKILFATQFFDPEPVMKGSVFARRLRDVAGDEVTVITGFPNYPSGKLYDGYRIRLIRHDDYDGIRVIRLPLIPGHGRKTLVRIANYLSFFISLLIWGLLNARKYDVIHVYHPPMTVGLAVTLFARLHRRPFVIEVQDLWPESVVTSGIAGTGTLGRLIGAMCSFVYRRADHVIAQSHGMAEVLADRGARREALSVVYNWSNTECAPSRRAVDGRQSYKFLYTGNVGIYQDLDTVIAAARIAYAADPRIRFTMIGGGAEKSRLVAQMLASDGRFLEFRDSVPQADLIDVVADADCLVLHLKDMPFFEFTIPSKIPFYLAMGKPVLAGLRGEAARMLHDSGAAVVVAPQEPEAMAGGMLLLARECDAKQARRGAGAIAYYKRELAMDRAVRQIHTLLTDRYLQ